MSKLRENMIREMTIKGFCERTKKNYIHQVEEFVRRYQKSPERLGSEEIRNYLYYLETEKKLSRSYNAQAYSALKFLYYNVLQLNWDGFRIPRSKKKGNFLSCWLQRKYNEFYKLPLILNTKQCC